MQCGLLGETLCHSYSPQIHNMLGDYHYDLYEVAPDNLKLFLKSKQFDRLNVTIPYKKSVIPYCKKVSAIAKKLGSVNTIIRDKNGNLIGHNSDYYGFSSLLDKSGLSVCAKKVLVLGSGGASNTVCAVLRERKANVVVISRTGDNNYQNLHLHQDAAIIVNTTPVGMYPNNNVSPIDIDLFPHLEGVLDLIYNPSRTRLLLDAEKRGLIVENGLWMLVAQAKESAEWFVSHGIDNNKIPQIYQTLQRQMQNIILIGMPGSGKSTVGNLLAKSLGREFIDIDCKIEEAAGISIPEIFSTQGEAGFRKLEHQVLSEYTKLSNCVIATGGGAVTVPENYNLLKQNGVVIWLKRDISQLATNDRPLSQATSLEAMYTVRKPMYEALADHTVFNDISPEHTVKQILALEDIG